MSSLKVEELLTFQENGEKGNEQRDLHKKDQGGKV